MRPTPLHIAALTLLIAAALSMLLPSCNSSDCSDNQNSLPLAGFFASESGAEIALSDLGIAGVGAPNDSVLSVGTAATEAYLPFRIDSDYTTYVLRYANTPERYFDTVTFRYDLQPWFVSSECGAIYRYKMRSIEYTLNRLDSVVCPSGVIDNTPGQNLRIYFRTQQTSTPD